MSDLSLPCGDSLLLRWQERRNTDSSVVISIADGIVTCGKPSNLPRERCLGLLEPLVLSGHLREVIGQWDLNKGRAWLWLTGRRMVDVAGQLRIALPSFWQKDQAELLFREAANRLHALGFHGVILGACGGCGVEQTVEGELPLATLVEGFQQYGVAVGVRPSVSGMDEMPPFGDVYRQQCREILGSLVEGDVKPDLLVWESACHHQSIECLGTHLLMEEALLAEMHLVEECSALLKGRLFLLPWGDGIDYQRQARHLQHLAEEAGVGTSLAFHAWQGPLETKAMAPHPIWNLIRSRIGGDSLPVAPVCNIGGVGLGEGLWPCRYDARLVPVFDAKDVVLSANSLPRPTSLAAASLWAAGWAVATGRPASSFYESWLTAYRPNWGVHERQLLCEITALVEEIAALEPGCHADKAAAMLTWIERQGAEVESDLSCLVQAFVHDCRGRIAASGASILGAQRAFGFWSSSDRVGSSLPANPGVTSPLYPHYADYFLIPPNP